MLEILLIRHGQTSWNRTHRIMGELSIGLDATGRRQIRAMGRLLRGLPVGACYTSPALRTVESARLLVGRRRIPLHKERGVVEIAYGDWVGRYFSEVKDDPAFRFYWKDPGKSRIPGGERLVQVQRRAVRFLETLRKGHRSGRVVVVSHADVIKLVLLHYLGMNLKDLHRLRIDNGSLSILWFHQKLSRVLTVNLQSSVRPILALPNFGIRRRIH